MSLQDSTIISVRFICHKIQYSYLARDSWHEPKGDAHALKWPRTELASTTQLSCSGVNRPSASCAFWRYCRSECVVTGTSSRFSVWYIAWSERQWRIRPLQGTLSSFSLSPYPQSTDSLLVYWWLTKNFDWHWHCLLFSYLTKVVALLIFICCYQRVLVKKDIQNAQETLNNDSDQTIEMRWRKTGRDGDDWITLRYIT